MKRRVIISGGGTGGHIYPALTIADAIRQVTDVEFLYVGSENGLETELVPKANIPFISLRLHGFERRLTPKNGKTAWEALQSVAKAGSILRDFHPDIVIGTGGYVCGPMLLAAALSGVPTLIQEQNVVPGITNRLLSKVVRKIALGYEEAAAQFHQPKKIVVTGNPVRRDILAAQRDVSRKRLGLPDDAFVLLAAGGSRGARVINQAMQEVLTRYQTNTGIVVMHVTGEQEYERFMQGFTLTDEKNKHLRVYPYLHTMPDALAAADLVVYRAGAVGLAELTALGRPSILVPYPYAAADHQRRNAAVLAQRGAAVVIENEDLTGALLYETIESLRQNRTRLEAMASASRSLGRPQAAEDIAKLALSMMG